MMDDEAQAIVNQGSNQDIHKQYQHSNSWPLWYKLVPFDNLLADGRDCMVSKAYENTQSLPDTVVLQCALVLQLTLTSTYLLQETSVSLDYMITDSKQ